MLPFSSTAPSENNHTATETDLKNRNFLLVLAFSLGAAFRLLTPIVQGFVVMDGGLFTLFAEGIRLNGFVFPSTVPYSTVEPNTPFCYPPLSFYLVALFNLVGVPIEWSLRFLPAVFSTATIWVVWRLARTVTRDLEKTEIISAVATFFFALLPAGFTGMIMGGGISRSPGLLFALWCVERAIHYWRDEANPKVLGQAVLLLSLTILCHLERAHFLLITVFAVWLVYNRKPKGFLAYAGWLGGGIILTSPWWGLCLSRFGLEPFLAANSSGTSAWLIGRKGWFGDQQFFNLMGVEYIFPLLTLFALIGMVVFWRKLPFLWVWTIFILLFEIRSGRIFLSAPIVIAAATTLTAIQPQLLRRLIFIVMAIWLTFQASYILPSLPASQRIAMRWCQERTPIGAKFFVVPVQRSWSEDLAVEWFPALALRSSPITPQGTEWLKRGTFARQLQRYNDVTVTTNWADMQRKLAYYQTKFNWIFYPKVKDNLIDHEKIQNEIRADKNWKVAFENEGAIIFSRKTQQ